MELLQFALRCVRPPVRAVSHPSTYHRVVHYVGHFRHHVIHHLAKHVPSNMGLVCKLVPIALGIGASALVPPTALGPFVPAGPMLIEQGFEVGQQDGSGDSTGIPGGLSDLGRFGFQDRGQLAAGTPASPGIGNASALADVPLEIVVDPSGTQSVFPSVDVPPRVTPKITTYSGQSVPEPAGTGMLGIGLIGLFLARHRIGGAKVSGRRRPQGRWGMNAMI